MPEEIGFRAGDRYSEDTHSTDAYDYDLPSELIAQQPLARRDASRLLLLSRASGETSHHQFEEILSCTRPGDLLVLNETKVLAARLHARRETGGKAEILLIRPSVEGRWLAMVRPGARIRPGDRLTVEDRSGNLAGRVQIGEADSAGLREIEILTDDALNLMSNAGEVPLPPYIQRRATEDDIERYQTAYARVPGAVAAPTAGLHFSPELIDMLGNKGVRIAKLILHVGPGTFRPVTTADFTRHQIDEEWCEVTEETAADIRETKRCGNRVIAVGTTTTRCLESIAGENGGRVEAYQGWVNLFVYPPYEFRVLDALITNFHLPKSSLLLLVAAFAGREAILSAYREAVRERYRFYSYGDAMFIQ